MLSTDFTEAIAHNLIIRKNIREDALQRLRGRERIEGRRKFRTSALNKAIELNANAPVERELLKQKLDQSQFPEHIAVVPDGNRRWAHARGLPVGAGYARGSEKLEELRHLAMVDNAIQTASVFVLSTENIENRPDDELDQLYDVFVEFFNRVAETDEVHDRRIRHEVRGSQEHMGMLPDRVLDAKDNMENATSSYNQRQVIFLMPYGGRREIIEASKKSFNGSPLIGEKGEDSVSFRENMLTGDLPDVDLMVRTSEVRLSNFLLWHNSYSEMVFFNKHWPDFSASDFYEAIYKYANRDRRFGV